MGAQGSYVLITVFIGGSLLLYILYLPLHGFINWLKRLYGGIKKPNTYLQQHYKHKP